MIRPPEPSVDAWVLGEDIPQSTVQQIVDAFPPTLPLPARGDQPLARALQQTWGGTAVAGDGRLGTNLQPAHSRPPAEGAVRWVMRLSGLWCLGCDRIQATDAAELLPFDRM